MLPALLLFLALTGSAYGTQCECGALKTCLEGIYEHYKTVSMDKPNECFTQCSDQLGDYKDAVSTCHNQKMQDRQAWRDSHVQHKEEVMSCLFRESNACSGGARYKRDHHECHECHQHMFERMKETFPAEFGALYTCMNTCLGDDARHMRGGGKSGKVAKAFGKCAQQLNCEIDTGAVASAYRQCKPTAPEGVSTMTQHCQCVADAFGVTDFDCSHESSSGEHSSSEQHRRSRRFRS